MSIVANQFLSIVSTNASNNTAVVRYRVTCTCSGESYNNYTQNGKFIVNGISYDSFYTLPANTTTTVFTKDVTVGNASGRLVSASYSFPTTPAGGMKTGNASITIPTLAKAPVIKSFSIARRTINSVTLAFTADTTLDYAQYMFEGSSWRDLPTNNVIGSLSVNTTYKVKIRVRGKSSQLWTESNYISVTTYDIGRISSVNNFNHGDSVSVKITNPSGMAINLVMKIGSMQILSKSVSAGTNNISFTDAQLDSIYKLYGSSNVLTATFVLTSGSYTNSKFCTIFLKRKSEDILCRCEW